MHACTPNVHVPLCQCEPEGRYTTEDLLFSLTYLFIANSGLSSLQPEKDSPQWSENVCMRQIGRDRSTSNFVSASLPRNCWPSEEYIESALISSLDSPQDPQITRPRSGATAVILLLFDIQYMM